MSGTHDGWEYQGRQSHGWFGNGTKPPDQSASERESLAERIHGLGHTLLASLPRSRRSHAALPMGAADHARFDRLMQAMVRDRSLSPAAFAARFFDTDAGAPYVGPFRRAAQLVADAGTAAQMRDASDQVAAGVLAVGLDRWLPFLREADGRATGRGDAHVILARSGPEPDIRVPTLPAPGSPLAAEPLPPAMAAVVAATGFLMGLYQRREAEAAVREAAQRFGLDLRDYADLRAAIAYAYVEGAGPRVLRELSGGDVDREQAAEAIMRAERARPGLLARALDGQPIQGAIKDDAENAHIPLSEYMHWSAWNKI